MNRAMLWGFASGAMVAVTVVTAVRGDWSGWFAIAAVAFAGRALLERGRQ